MSDHEIIVTIIAFGVTFFLVDAGWKINVQRRLDRLERTLNIKE